VTYKADMKWRSGKDIEASIDRTIFELQVKDYTWTKVLSIKPRKCYWSNDIIKPFSYAMIAEMKPPFVENAVDHLTVEEFKHTFPGRWVSMRMYIYLKLKGKL